SSTRRNSISIRSSPPARSECASMNSTAIISIMARTASSAAAIGQVQTNGRPIETTPVPEGTPGWGAEWKKAVADYYLSNIKSGSIHGSFYSYRDVYLDLDPTYTDRFGPKNFMGGDKSGEYLHGSNLQGWFAPNITNDERTGLGRWSVDDIVQFLKTGHNRIGAAVGPMAEEVMHASSAMSDNDLKAIATYLKDQPGGSNKPAPLPQSDPQIMAGEAIYRDQCAACHQIDGKGVARLFPALSDSPMA